MKRRLTSSTVLNQKLIRSFTSVATTIATATVPVARALQSCKTKISPNTNNNNNVRTRTAWFVRSHLNGADGGRSMSTIPDAIESCTTPPPPPTTTTTTNNSKPRKKIAVAMSGGVDSSVVAYLLSKRHPTDELIGIHMSNWDYADEDPTATTTMKSNKNNSHCWEQDWKDANAVAEQLNIPIHHVSFQAEYWNEVFQPYCQQLSQSITPNPDVDCNRYIKFGALKDYLKERFGGDVDGLATGHYARIWDRSRRSCCDYNYNYNYNYHDGAIGIHATINNDMPDYLRQALEEEESTILADYVLHSSVAKTPLLCSALDRSKDQSYFLSGVKASALSGVLFPLGDLYKTERGAGSTINNFGNDSDDDDDDDSSDNHNDMLSVRQWAQHARLPNATKRDSVGICFIGKRKHGDFVNEYVDNPLIVDYNSHNGHSSSSSSLVQCINVENNEVVATFDPLESPSLTYATIGQGAKLSGATQKWFVVDKQLQPPPVGNKQDQWKWKWNSNSNSNWKWERPCVVVCPGTHHPSLYADRFYVRSDRFNWMAGGGETNRPPPLPFRAKCRIRHLQPLVDCEIVLLSNGRSGEFEYESEYEFESEFKFKFDGDALYEIRLQQPLRGIAPGQVCVVYAGGKEGDLICIGGGPIDQRGPSYWELQKDLPTQLHPSGHNDVSVVPKRTP